jgi:hypothetical protein
LAPLPTARLASAGVVRRADLSSPFTQTVAIAGRLGQVELAIVGQGLMISAVTGSVVALAATSAQVTLSAPIFTSPTQPVTDVGVVLQRTVILANVGMLPIYVLWWNIEAVVRHPSLPLLELNGRTLIRSLSSSPSTS